MTPRCPEWRAGHTVRSVVTVWLYSFLLRLMASVSGAGALLAAIGSATPVTPELPSTDDTRQRVRVTCTVPKSQPERQLAPNSCVNWLSDGTQTYTARVLDRRGRPVAGVWVRWTDSDARGADFRLRQNPCRTGPHGFCSAELDDEQPSAGEKITVTATVGTFYARGHLTFRAR
jgi:hypothetical protein